MTTIATPNWQSGRITLPESAWNGFRGTVEHELRPVGPGRYALGPLKLTLAETHRLVYWAVDHHPDPDPGEEWLSAQEALTESLGLVRWEEGTGGSIYGGAQDGEYVKHAWGPRGERDRRRYEHALANEDTEGRLVGADREARKSDVFALNEDGQVEVGHEV